jgi:putative ABC transport system permease protein
VIRNYIKLAWRNLAKNKAFSFINIFGLSIGLTCCMLIGLYIHHEFSYDKHFKNASDIYQLGTTFVRQGNEDNNANTPAPMAGLMQQEFPEIEKSTRLIRLFADDKTLFQTTVAGGGKGSFYETQGYLADSTFFQVFAYPFIEGNPSAALIEPNSLVITEPIARKLFGKEPALNKVVHISSNSNGDHDFRITGVIAASTQPSHIDARFFISLKGGAVDEYLSRQTGLASNNMCHTYFALRPDSDPAKLETKFKSFIDKYAGADLKAMGIYKRQFLTRLTDIHLFSRAKDNLTPAGNTTYLYILGSIALFTLLIACINFMNLSTARSAKRAAEVGVRKVLGAERRSLIGQFLGESLIMALIGFVIATLFTFLLLPAFIQVSGKDIQFSWTAHGWMLALYFLLAVVTGLLAGSYPAFYLSAFQPIKVLKGRISNSLAAVSLRRGLVVFQFVVSVILIVASVVIGNQMRYMRSKDLGFTKDQQVVIPLRSETAKKVYASMKDELRRNPGIISVGASQYYPGVSHPSDIPLYKEGGNMNDAHRVYMNYVDEDFMQTLGIQPVAGRLYSAEFKSDTNSRIILNEQAIKDMGFSSSKDAVQQKVYVDWQGVNYKIEVIGVVRDFHFNNLHSAIGPYGFQLQSNGDFNYLVAHARSENLPATLQAIEGSWHKLNPNEPFEYNFLDDAFQKSYAADERLNSLVSYFTVIAILISCLGLFGLATFSAEQRTKEIGVRKVLGASVAGIIALLSKDFMRLVAIALVIGCPVAGWIMYSWLKDFPYRTGLGWQVFAITAAVSMLIALLTVSFQAIRAALMNPVKSLRTE